MVLELTKKQSTSTVCGNKNLALHTYVRGKQTYQHIVGPSSQRSLQSLLSQPCLILGALDRLRVGLDGGVHPIIRSTAVH